MVDSKYVEILRNKIKWQIRGDALGLRWEFTEEDVNRQIRILASIRLKYREPEPKEMSGSEFIVFVENYNQRKKDE